MKLTFLGTGTSFGVPQVGCHCAVCRSDDPRDRRSRCGALVETDGGTRLLIDTPPELRLQLVGNGIDDIDAVLYTHGHADHIHGIDDLRAFTVRRTIRCRCIARRPSARSTRFPTSWTTAQPRRAPRSQRPAVPVFAGTLPRGDADVLPFLVPQCPHR